MTPRGATQEYGAVFCHGSTVPLAASCGAFGVAPMSPGPWISSCPYPAMPPSLPPASSTTDHYSKTTPQVRDLQILRPQIRRSVHRCAVDMSDSYENFSPSLRHLNITDQFSTSTMAPGVCAWTAPRQTSALQHTSFYIAQTRRCETFLPWQQEHF